MGWAAIDALRAAGVPIDSSIMAKVFPGSPQGERAADVAPIRKVEPKGPPLSVLAVLRESAGETKRTEELDALAPMGRKLLKLDPHTGYVQVTLVVNTERPNLSYTCVVPKELARAAARKNQMVFARMEARSAGRLALWVITDLNPI